MICRPGYHHVKKHFRISKNGAKHTVEEHCRKNQKSKEKFLYRSNLNYIYKKLKDNYQYKKLNRIKGYPQDKGQYDELIQFWLKYWKDQGLIKDDIDPLLVKAIIACESSFRENIVTTMPGSTATGLMQIVKKTMRILAKKLGNEIRKANIDITQEEAKEANTNIAAGIRWLIYKITTSLLGKVKIIKRIECMEELSTIIPGTAMEKSMLKKYLRFLINQNNFFIFFCY